MEVKTTRQKLKKIPNAIGLYRHESGTYYGRLKIKGKTKLSSLGTSDRKLADRKLNDSRGDEKARTGEIILEKLCEKFKDSKAGYKRGTKDNIDTVINSLKKHCACFKELVHKILPSDLAAYFGKLTISNRSHNDYSLIVSQIFDLAVADGYLSKNPVKAIPNLRKKVKKGEDTIPSWEDFEKIVADIRSQVASDTKEETANFVSFYGRAAIGEAEASEMDWKHIDFIKEQVKFQRVKTEEYFYVPFFPWLKPFILDLWVKAEKPSSGRVFPIRSAKQAIINACKRLGIDPHYSPRDFRKMGIVKQLRAGIPVKLVSKFQGHTDGGKLILDTYTNVICSEDEDYEKKVLKDLATNFS